MSIPDKLTVTTKDGQWKADMKAWKNYAFVYASIGSEVSVYQMRETTDTWGNKTRDWVDASAEIVIRNTYKGTLGSGGLGNFVQTGQFNTNDAQLKEWAVGLFSISINVDTGQVGAGPQSASLGIDSVQAEISVSTPSGPLVGTVAASSIVSDNSIWG